MCEHSLTVRSTVDQLNLFSDQVVEQLVLGANTVWLTELAGQLGCGTPAHIKHPSLIRTLK